MSISKIPNNLFTCDICHKEHKSIKSLRSHRWWHDTVKPGIISSYRPMVIKTCQQILGIDNEITEDHLLQVKEIIQKHVDDGMYFTEIRRQLYPETSPSFSYFITHYLKIERFSKHYITTPNSVNSEEKTAYYKACAFTFDPYSIPEIPGYEKLLELNFYHSVLNPKGVSRDHMISRAFGWINKVPPEIMSHPANCQFMDHAENMTKNSKSSLTIDELKKRIEENNFCPIKREYIKLTKGVTSDKVKDKISTAVSEWKRKNPSILITDGKITRYLPIDKIIPKGFIRGRHWDNKKKKTN